MILPTDYPLALRAITQGKAPAVSKPRPKTKQVNFRFSVPFLARIEAAAKAREWTVSAFVRAAISREVRAYEAEENNKKNKP